MLITAQDQRTKCEREYYDCLAKEDAKAQATVQSGGIIDQSHLASCSTLAEIQSLSDGPDLACDMATSDSVLGMAAWRWLLFLGLFWPTQLAARLATKLVSVVMQLYCKSRGKIPQLYTHALESPVANAVRACAWIGVWFALAKQPLSWAHQAHTWNEYASSEAWPTVFETVHFVVWRLLVLWALLLTIRALIKCVGRHLAVRFHYSHQYSELSHEQEELLRHLMVPRSTPAKMTLRFHGRSGIVIYGEDCVWWSALRYLDGIAQQHEGDIACHAEVVCKRLCAYFAHEHGVSADMVRVRASTQAAEGVCVNVPASRDLAGEPVRMFSDPTVDPVVNAKRLAAAIFLNVHPPGPPVTKLPRRAGVDGGIVPKEVWELVASTEKRPRGAGNESISMSDLTKCIVTMRRDSARLHSVLYNHASVVSEAESVMGGGCLGVLAVVVLALFNPSSLAYVWSGLSVVMIALCFVFGNSTRELYESCVFLFWVRPFNMFDVLHVQDSKVVVDSIHLRYIEVTRDHGLSAIIPLRDLMNSHVVNETRSAHIWKTVEFDADTAITLAQCTVVADEVQDAIKKHADLLAGDYCVNLAPSSDKIMLCVSFTRFPVKCYDMLTDHARTYIVDAVCLGMSKAGIKYASAITDHHA